MRSPGKFAASVTTPQKLTELEISRASEPAPWHFSSRGLAIRLFFTCWLVYALHFATNTVREIYPALSLGDHFSFRVDEYANMHPDLFEKKGYGWHIGNNPGASMLAAIPYAIARPIIDRVVERVQRSRATSGQTEPAPYNSPLPMARDFYKEAWRRGFDVKFGLAALVTQSLCMAPSSALGVVVMFFLLRRLFGSDKTAIWLSLLYAFGTPVFFRTGFLNHNLMLGHFAFMGFVAMWNPGNRGRWSTQTRFFLGGVAGGTALLFDYSGAVLLLGLLFIWPGKAASGLRRSGRCVSSRLLVCAGNTRAVILLWFYQWQSFGHPFYPGQHWMSSVEWVRPGYRGINWPQLELLLLLIFDYRYGLFLSSPLLILGLICPLIDHGTARRLPRLELLWVLGICLVLWLFFSCFHGVRVQFNTGIRYMAPGIPRSCLYQRRWVLMRLPRRVIYLVGFVRGD